MDLKDYKDKLPMEDVKPILMKAVASVMQYGRKKYGMENPCSYEEGEIKHYQGALLRHLNLMQYGQVYDEESGLPHSWHIIMNAYIIAMLEEQQEKLLKELKYQLNASPIIKVDKDVD